MQEKLEELEDADNIKYADIDSYHHLLYYKISNISFITIVISKKFQYEILKHVTSMGNKKCSEIFVYNYKIQKVIINFRL